MERHAVVVILTAEGQPILVNVSMLNTLDDASVSKIGVTLKDVLMIEDKLIKNGSTIDAD